MQEILVRHGTRFLLFPAEAYDSHPGIGEVLEMLDGIRSQRWVQMNYLRTVGHDDDFEDEVYFKRGRVVTPRFQRCDLI